MKDKEDRDTVLHWLIRRGHKDLLECLILYQNKDITGKNEKQTKFVDYSIISM